MITDILVFDFFQVVSFLLKKITIYWPLCVGLIHTQRNTHTYNLLLFFSKELLTTDVVEINFLFESIRIPLQKIGLFVVHVFRTPFITYRVNFSNFLRSNRSYSCPFTKPPSDSTQRYVCGTIGTLECWSTSLTNEEKTPLRTVSFRVKRVSKTSSSLPISLRYRRRKYLIIRVVFEIEKKSIGWTYSVKWGRVETSKITQKYGLLGYVWHNVITDRYHRKVCLRYNIVVDWSWSVLMTDYHLIQSNREELFTNNLT